MAVCGVGRAFKKEERTEVCIIKQNSLALALILEKLSLYWLMPPLSTAVLWLIGSTRLFTGLIMMT
jgi:hypothetical protein